MVDDRSRGLTAIYVLLLLGVGICIGAVAGLAVERFSNNGVTIGLVVWADSGPCRVASPLARRAVPSRRNSSRHGGGQVSSRRLREYTLLFLLWEDWRAMTSAT